MSAESLRYLQGVQDTALERFRVAVAQFRAPSFEEALKRPPTAHLEALDEKLEELRALEGQLQQIAAMVDGNLPVGGESAVVGEDAERLTQIAQAMADGLLPASLFDTSSAEAVALIERREAIERDREARRRDAPEVFARVSGETLRDRRHGSLGNIANLIEREKERRAEAERLAWLELQRREQEAAEAAATAAAEARRMGDLRKRQLLEQAAARKREIARLQADIDRRNAEIARKKREEERAWGSFNTFLGILGALGEASGGRNTSPTDNCPYYGKITC